MKKLFAILLALALVLSMSAMAATIAVVPPTVPTGATEAGITYKAYKVFDATLSGENNANVSYTLTTTKNSTLYTLVEKYFTLTETSVSGVFNVTKKADFNAANFAKELSGNVSLLGTAVDFTKQTDGNYKTATIADGYYLVTSSVGGALMLDTFNTDTINDKNVYPTIDKKPDANTHNKGDIVTYTISVNIPANATGTIVVHDTMTGLKYQSMTAVDGITVNTSPANAHCTVEFTLAETYVKANLGKTVEIKYTAKITADTANNEAYLVNNGYTSNPDGGDEKVYNSTIVIDKCEKNDASKKLPGAKFVLKCTQTGSENKDKYYKLDKDELNNDVVSWVTTIADATVVTTDTNGAASFTGLADGTYALIETEAPAGYNLLTTEVTVTVDHDAENTISLSQTIKVENSTGSELPSTGGIGTTIFYVVGGLMVAVAIVLLVAKRKASSK